MTTIQPTFLYGVRSGVDNGVHFTADSTLLYPAGSGVALVSVSVTIIMMMRDLMPDFEVTFIYRCCSIMSFKKLSAALYVHFRPCWVLTSTLKVNSKFCKNNFCKHTILGGDQRTKSEPCFPGKQGDPYTLILVSLWGDQKMKFCWPGRTFFFKSKMLLLTRESESLHLRWTAPRDWLHLQSKYDIIILFSMIVPNIICSIYPLLSLLVKVIKVLH